MTTKHPDVLLSENVLQDIISELELVGGFYSKEVYAVDDKCQYVGEYSFYEFDKTLSKRMNDNRYFTLVSNICRNLFDSFLIDILLDFDDSIMEMIEWPLEPTRKRREVYSAVALGIYWERYDKIYIKNIDNSGMPTTLDYLAKGREVGRALTKHLTRKKDAALKRYILTTYPGGIAKLTIPPITEEIYSLILKGDPRFDALMDQHGKYIQKGAIQKKLYAMRKEMRKSD